MNPPDFDAFWDGGAHASRGAAARREVDAAAGLRHRGRGLLADQPAERRPDRRARAGSTASSACRARPGKYPAVLSVPGAGVRPYRGLPELAGARPDHLPDRHPRHPRHPAAGGLRQPGQRRPERLSDLRPRFARALLLPPRLHRNAARQRFPDVAAAVGRPESGRHRRQPGRRAGDRDRGARPARDAAGRVLSRRSRT